MPFFGLPRRFLSSSGSGMESFALVLAVCAPSWPVYRLFSILASLLSWALSALLSDIRWACNISFSCFFCLDASSRRCFLWSACSFLYSNSSCCLIYANSASYYFRAYLSARLPSMTWMTLSLSCWVLFHFWPSKVRLLSSYSFLFCLLCSL